eukprot:7390307-Prymnesium_polylepis.1
MDDLCGSNRALQALLARQRPVLVQVIGYPGPASVVMSGLEHMRAGARGTLDWSRKSLSDADCGVLCKCLVSRGSLANIHQLSLHGNCIGDAGAQALAEASGMLAKLARLYLHSNQIGDAGMRAIGAACGRGALQQLI